MVAIQYKKHHDIDKVKWDRLIKSSPQGFIYSRSFFLDAMCSWDALIMGDYEYVMPLPIRKKAGFHYIYTPFFTGQLGITGEQEVSESVCKEFIQAIPSSFSFIDLQLNEYNDITGLENVHVKHRVNYIIALNRNYAAIATGYNKDAKKNLRQGIKQELSFADDISLKQVFELYKKAYGHLNKRITEKEYEYFFSACSKAIELNLGFLCGLKNPSGEIVAAAFFAKDDKRIYYLLGAPTAEGKKANATHILIDEVIKKYATTGLVFDFEGSDIPSVANFYKKFGPEKKTYPHIIINRLPFWIKWLKKT